MGKIDEFIEKKKLLPRDLAYHTNRSLKPKGRIRVLVAKEDNVARAEYMCPECGHQDYAEEEWKRPFSVKCARCGFRITVPRMRAQFKKEMKAEWKKGKK